MATQEVSSRQRSVPPTSSSLLLNRRVEADVAPTTSAPFLPSTDNRERISSEQNNSARPKMATAVTVSPTGPFQHGPPPPYNWQPSAYSPSGLVSPPASRTTFESRPEERPNPPAAPLRQSLPSIHEIVSNGTTSDPYVSPVSASVPSTQTSFPPPQSQQLPASRTYTEHSSYPPQRHPSPPQPIYPGNHTDSRNGSHTSLHPAPAPPTNPYAVPRYDITRRQQEARDQEIVRERQREQERERERLSNGHPYHQPPQNSYVYLPQQQHPPAPSHPPQFSSPRYSSRDSRDQNAWKGGPLETSGVPAFQQGLKRHLDGWDFENNLAQINTSSAMLQEWSQHFHKIAGEQPRENPERMPTLDSCHEMIEHSRKIQLALDRMSENIRQQNFSANLDHRMKDHSGKLGGDYDDDGSMFGDDKNQGYGLPESKKRRGRAAPPGRCHSCNRAETPEWRRGPDGARTLCNACGLHYAKLTRKNTLKNQPSSDSPLRPKSMDDRNGA